MKTYASRNRGAPPSGTARASAPARRDTRSPLHPLVILCELDSLLTDTADQIPGVLFAGIKYQGHLADCPSFLDSLLFRLLSPMDHEWGTDLQWLSLNQPTLFQGFACHGPKIVAEFACAPVCFDAEFVSRLMIGLHSGIPVLLANQKLTQMTR